MAKQKIKWELIKVKAGDLKKNPDNPKKRDPEGFKKLQKLTDKFGIIFSGVVNKDLTIIDGHSRNELSKPDDDVFVFAPSIQIKESEYKELNLLFDMAKAGEIDMQIVEKNFTEEFFTEWNIEAGDNKKQPPEEEPKISPAAANKKLTDKFIIPPFSVFDTKQGYWQERKRYWLAIGIRSEIGRGGHIKFSEAATIPRNGQSAASFKIDKTANGKGKAKSFNEDLKNNPASAGGLLHKGKTTEWVDYVQNNEEAKTAWQGDGTSIFDPVLTEISYRWFCPAGGTILDSFAGGSVRGIVAAKLGFKYTGIDLRPEQVNANKANALEVLKKAAKPTWITGNSLNIDKLASNVKADMLFSCPPYHDLEIYSDDPEDISNMPYETFIKQYREIVQKSVALLQPDRFAGFVVADIRDSNGFYKNFVSDTIQAFQDAGAKLYNEIILVNVAGSLPIRVGRQFNGGRKVGKMHQNILVFYKGDPKAIKKNFPDIDLSELTVKEIQVPAGVEQL